MNMEREQYQNQIKDLLQAVETLLKSNKAMGERVTQLEKVAEAYDDLKAKYAKLEGELAMRKRAQYGKGSEKPKDAATSESDADKTKDEDEQDYIENGSKNNVPPTDDDQEGNGENSTPVKPQEKKPRDLSNRPDHHNTMHSDICVVHDCDLEKLKKLAQEFIDLISILYKVEVAAAWLTFIETCKLQKKAALDFFQEFFKKITEGRTDYELIAQE